MTVRLTFDLEVLPSIHADPATWPCTLPKPPEPGKVPGNIKDPGKIAARQAALNLKHATAVAGYAAACDESRAESFAKGSLHPLQGRILCIGYAFESEPPAVLWADYYSERCDHEAIEADLLYRFARVVTADRPNKWIAHRAAYDLTMVRMRSEKYEIKPLLVSMPWTKKEAWDRVHCTYEHSQAQMKYKGASLDGLAKYYRIPGKPEGIDGSQVFAAWKAGRHDEIREYCANDVEVCRAVARKQGVSL